MAPQVSHAHDADRNRFRHVLDESQASARAYYCTARGFCPDIKFPETYIVDQKGQLVGYVVGPRDWAHPAAREYLERLIGS